MRRTLGMEFGCHFETTQHVECTGPLSIMHGQCIWLLLQPVSHKCPGITRVQPSKSLCLHDSPCSSCLYHMLIESPRSKHLLNRHNLTMSDLLFFGFQELPQAINVCVCVFICLLWYRSSIHLCSTLLLDIIIA